MSLKISNYFRQVCGLLMSLIVIAHETDAQEFVRSVDVEAQSLNEIKIPSPVASAFSEYVVNPVGYYTGVPRINVGIHEIKLKDFTLPISMNYHSGGVKIEEVPSNVGLNWNLAAFGVINRAVKDKPDDASIEFCNDVWYLYGPCQNCPTQPVIEGKTPCGNGLLWILNPPVTATYPNANYDGLPSYDIDLNAFNGPTNTNTSSMKLLKMFYGVALQEYSSSENIYLLSMADKEPDIYYFNFPGHTGEFMFDVNSGTPKIKIVPYQDIKIEYTTNAQKKLSSFKITDEKGIVYYFNAIETTIHETIGNTTPVDEGLDQVWDTQVRNYESGSSKKEYYSSWFLSRIETPLKQFLDFTYADEQYIISNLSPQQTGLSYMSPFSSKAANYDPNLIDTYGYHMALIQNQATLKTKRIATIENNEIKVSFNASHLRQDLVPGLNSAPAPYAIDEIVIYNKIGTLSRVKKFKLTFDYFLSDITESITPKSSNYIFDHYYDFQVTDSAKYYKRLRLLSIQEFGKDDQAKAEPYKFEYKYYDFTGDNTHRLPHRLSYQQDVWGYYNAASGNKTLIPSLYVYPDNYPIRDSRQFSLFKKNTFTGGEYLLPGANRLPNSSTQDIGMLTKIVYPTKGYTQYQFEPHVFKYEGQDYSGGGLRIKQIVKNDNENSSNNIVYNYSYVNANNTSSGSIISLPILAVRNINIWGGADPNSIIEYKIRTTRYSMPQSNLSSTNGSFVGYRTVTESQQGNGKTVFSFSMPAVWNVQNDIPIANNGFCDPQIDGYCDGFYQRTAVVNIFVPLLSPVDPKHPATPASDLIESNYDLRYNPAAPNTFPFPDNPNYDWQRGHLLAEKYYDNSNKLLKENLYTYTNYFPNNQTTPSKIYGYKFANYYPLLNDGNRPKTYVFKAAKYTILTDVAKMLLSKTEILHNTDDVTKTFSNQSTYSFENPNHTQATTITSVDSRGRVVKTINAYPWDFTGSEFGSDLLRSNHINDKLLRQTSFVNEVTTSKSETGYVLKNQMVVRQNIVAYADGVTESSRSLFDYDTKGNLVRLSRMIDTDANGTTVTTGANKSYLWGYNQTLPIAEATNALNNQIFHTSFEDFTDVNIASTDFKTGRKCWSGNYTIPPTQRPVSGNYIVTYWEKIGTGNWLLKTQTLTNTIPTQITSTGLIDEVRIYPVGAIMNTYTYDPLIGLTSKTDANNQTEYYQYDDLGRLKCVKDFEGNIIKYFEYNYQLRK